MRGEEEFFPKGSVWYCDQCKSVGTVEIEVWIDPTTVDILNNTVVPGGYEGWCHNCEDEVVVKRDKPDAT